MTITNGYATLAEFIAYAKVPSVDAVDDSVIENIIEGVSRQIDAHVGRVFFVTTATARYFHSEDTDILAVDDISALTSLAVETDNDGDGVYENVWTSADYNVIPYQPVNGEPYIMLETSVAGTQVFSKARKGNKVTALWGWAAVPDQVRQACLIAAEAEYHSRFGENMSGVATITGAGVVITPKGLPQSALQKLETFRRIL